MTTYTYKKEHKGGEGELVNIANDFFNIAAFGADPLNTFSNQYLVIGLMTTNTIEIQQIIYPSSGKRELYAQVYCRSKLGPIVPGKILRRVKKTLEGLGFKTNSRNNTRTTAEHL